MIEHLLLGFWTAFASFSKEGIPGGAQLTAGGGGGGSTANYIDEAGANNYIDEGANNNYVTET